MSEERRRVWIPEEQVNEIIEKAADRAAEKALKITIEGAANELEKRMLVRIGQAVISKFYLVIGITVFAVAAILAGKEFYK